MTKYDDVQTAWAAVDTATTELGERWQFIIDEINRTATEGLNGPQTEWVLTQATGLVATLNAMGRTPTNPIPNVPAEPAPIPGPFA